MWREAGGAPFNPGNYYFNIHTALNPNGVARGQLDNGSGGAPSPNPNPYQ